MKKNIKDLITFFLCAYLILQLISCQGKSPTEPEAGNLSTASWDQDIDYFSSQLKTSQYGFSSLISVQKFDNTINNLKNSVDSLKDYEIYLKLEQLVASFNVAHLVAYPSSVPRLHFLPIYTSIFPDGVYIIKTDQNNSGLLGKKITGVGGVPVQTVLDSLKKIIPHENDYWFEDQVPKMFCCPEVLKYFGFSNSESSAVFDIEGSGEVTLTAAAISVNFLPGDMKSVLDGKDIPLYLQNQSKYYWYKYIAADSALYIKYNKCANSTDISFDSFTNGIKDFISAHQVDKIIVDLRNNGGGNSSIINPLLYYIQGSPFNQSGKLFVITNRGTFSSALLNSISFKQNTDCILVGEPTGGKPNSYGEVRTFSLPNSGIFVQYCTKYFKTVGGDPESLFPDYDVEISFADYINCKDPVLDFILNYKRNY